MGRQRKYGKRDMISRCTFSSKTWRRDFLAGWAKNWAMRNPSCSVNCNFSCSCRWWLWDFQEDRASLLTSQTARGIDIGRGIDGTCCENYMTAQIICKNQKVSITLIRLGLIGLESPLGIWPTCLDFTRSQVTRPPTASAAIHEFHYTEINTTYSTM